MIAQGCFIRTHNHGFSTTTVPFRLQPRCGDDIIIESNVWLGVNVVVVKGGAIGKNTVVGACSLVNRRLPESVVAVGTPAKPIRAIPRI